MRRTHALALLVLSLPAQVAYSAPQDVVPAEEWAEAHLTSRTADPAFSFTYAGQPFAAIRKDWTVQRESKKLDAVRTQHILTWTDPVTKLEVRCTVTQYSFHPAVEWVLHLHNAGSEKTPIIEKLRPLDAPLLPSTTAATLHYSLGDSNSADSFAPQEKPLPPTESAPFTLAPRGGRSSDPYLPFFNLAAPNQGVAIALGWSGQWEATFKQTAQGLIATAGQQLTHFSLLPGETVRTPRMLLVFWQGSQPLRGNNLLRSTLIAHYIPRRAGQPVFPPICGSTGATAPDGTYEKPHIDAARILGQRGLEVFWSDMDPQQWYPIGFPEGTGTWEVDLKKYPHGLKPVGDAIKAAGLQYLLWFEPERVHPKTKIDTEHPEWVMKAQGEWSQLFRLHDPQARRWITDTVDKVITDAGVMWIRWDFNIDPLGFWRRNDAADRQGITEIGHIEGLYAMWDELESRHPGLLIDNCASGGRRIDLETCSRGLPLWHSDMQCSGQPSPAADQLQNAGLFRWIPMHGCAAFGYEPAYAFRSAMTNGNILCGSSTDGPPTAPNTSEAVQRTVALYQKLRPYTLGDFYPLFPHVKNEDAWFGYQFHRPDTGDGVAIVFRRAECKGPTVTLHLQGLGPGLYDVTYEDTPEKVRTDYAKLKAWPIRIYQQPGSAILYYRPVPSAAPLGR